MKVNLVNYELPFTSGILSKLAWRMGENLQKLGVRAVVTDCPDSRYDVNHHIIYLGYRHVGSINTLMITHINTEGKFSLLSKAMETADTGICFSQQTVGSFVERGISPNKLTYILPAHDEHLTPIPVAILTNIYPDGCKREFMLNELAKIIDTNRFIFKIMGRGWDVDSLRKVRLNVEYHPVFNRDVQSSILQNSKYYLYFGLDEGSMALLDAMNAGVKTIAPLDGFHIHTGVDFPFTTQEELNTIFLQLQTLPLVDWTWERYTREHVELWKALMKRKQTNA